MSNTIESIEQGNLIIADFMGVKIGVDNYLWRPGVIDKLKKENLNYHDSWGWLMPVVEKIETMDFGFKMCRKVVEVYVDSTKEIILKTKESCRLDSLYKAVVQFIEWYNNQKSNQ